MKAWGGGLIGPKDPLSGTVFADFTGRAEAATSPVSFTASAEPKREIGLHS